MSESAVKKETFGFQAEVKQLLHLMIHSLYSNKEIFLRELISNASDAADKLRFESLRDPMLLVDEPDLKVWVLLDKEAKTITIRDNGIGMTREEVIQNLGTIAKSGTREFLSTLTGDRAKDAQLIGQFGVGFYSSFIVADKVVVTTRKAGAPVTEGVRWSSAGEGDYELETVSKDTRGTEVVLHLKPDEDEFLNDWRLKHIIMKYSDHLTLPVLIKNEKNEDEVVNRATALWTLSKSEITDEQYKELYKHVSHDFQDPLVWTHNKVEGKLEYVTLLYIPEHAPFDLWHVGKTRGLKLYVRRVFIMDDAEQFLPHYLRFVRGIIDSNDLPLNISREILQSNRIIDTIKTAVIKRVLSMLEQLATDDKPKYQIFWNAFGQVLKEGPAEDFANKEQIAKLLRFASTHSDTADQTVSLEDYIARMPAGQTKIFYVTADTFNAASHSPHLEIFRKKGIEVLLLTDRVDEWLMTHLTEFQGKPVQAVTRGGLDLGDLADKTAEEHHKQAETDFEETVKKVKELLQSSVKDVRLSQRLTDSPACIVLDEQDMSGQMERMLRASGQQVPKQKPILELNPDHSMIKHLKGEQDSVRFEDWSRILLDQAILSEGGQLEDPASFVQRFNKLLLALTER
ncbi:MAG TPA: molecular chaperone HtpG [Gammaproteobacteria bacterium]|nr:molecular chaperone HtpG [Gammaproteobacteria bacterium]